MPMAVHTVEPQPERDRSAMSLRARVKHTATSSRFVRSVVVLAGGTALAQGLVVLASPVVTRLYSPDDYGTLAVFLAIGSVLAVVSALRYDAAIPVLSAAAMRTEWQEVRRTGRPGQLPAWRWLNLIRWAERFDVCFN